MSATARKRRGRRPAAGPAITFPAAAASNVLSGWTLWQRLWWALGAIGGLVAMLGFQTLSPSRRLAAVERVNARQDSVFAVQVAAQREALDTIRHQLGQLLAGQCVKERDRMARVVFGCGGR
jgi:hypothetical protein